MLYSLHQFFGVLYLGACVAVVFCFSEEADQWYRLTAVTAPIPCGICIMAARAALHAMDDQEQAQRVGAAGVTVMTTIGWGLRLRMAALAPIRVTSACGHVGFCCVVLLYPPVLTSFQLSPTQQLVTVASASASQCSRAS